MQESNQTSLSNEDIENNSENLTVLEKLMLQTTVARVLASHLDNQALTHLSQCSWSLHNDL